MSWNEKKISKFYHSRYVAPTSPDHSPFNNVCSVMLQWVYETLFRNINELEATGWSRKQNIINTAINE